MAFQLWSHSHLYSDRHNKKSARLPATQNITTEKAAAFLNKSRTNFRNYTKLQEATSSSFQSPTINSYPPPRSGGSSGTRPMYGQQRSFSTTSMDDTGSRMAFGRPTLRLVDQPNEQSTDSTLPLSMPGTPTTLVSASASGETLAELYESLPSYQQPEGTARDEMVKPPKQPKLSWFLTVFLLLTVTMVSAVRPCQTVLFDMNRSFTGHSYHCGLVRGIHGRNLSTCQQRLGRLDRPSPH
jgi:Ca2+:H+ antiporter